VTAPLGIIAGGGDLPVRVAEAVAASGRPVVVAVLEGHGDPAAYAGLPQASFRWGLAAQLLAWLRRQGVSQVVLAGTVARPLPALAAAGRRRAQAARRIGKAAFSGDDSILRAVMKVLAEDGFEILGAQQVLAGLLPSAALLAGRRRTTSLAPTSGAASPSAAPSAPSMSARAASSSRGSSWRSRPSRAPMPCSPARPAAPRRPRRGAGQGGEARPVPPRRPAHRRPVHRRWRHRRRAARLGLRGRWHHPAEA